MANREIATGGASIYPLTGDISSSAGSPTVTVTGLQGIPVEQTFITDPDFLVYDPTTNQWVPRLIVPGDVPLATSSTFGIVEPDNTTITISAGVISATAGGITQLTGDVTAGPGSGSQAATLANTAVTPTSYTNTNLTVDSKGRITAASNGSTAPSGSAGGDLSGAYPNPVVAQVNGGVVPTSATVVGTNASKQIVVAPASITAGTIGLVIDGGGSVPATGNKGFVQISYACTITGWTILADVSGSAQITVSKGTYAAFPTVTSIDASLPPVLTSAQKNTSTTLTGWTTSISAGDILSFNLDSVTTCTRVVLELNIIKV